jgi:hypothetical protein
MAMYAWVTLVLAGVALGFVNAWVSLWTCGVILVLVIVARIGCAVYDAGRRSAGKEEM